MARVTWSEGRGEITRYPWHACHLANRGGIGGFGGGLPAHPRQWLGAQSHERHPEETQALCERRRLTMLRHGLQRHESGEQQRRR